MKLAMSLRVLGVNPGESWHWSFCGQQCYVGQAINPRGHL